jgi:hypothetical protein
VSVAGFDHRTCVIFVLCVWWSVYLVRGRLDFSLRGHPVSTHAVTARVTAERVAPGFCFAGLVVLRPATDRPSDLSLRVFFEIDRVCGGLLDLKNERQQKIFEEAPGSRDLESLETKQHREQRKKKRASERAREERVRRSCQK